MTANSIARSLGLVQYLADAARQATAEQLKELRRVMPSLMEAYAEHRVEADDIGRKIRKIMGPDWVVSAEVQAGFWVLPDGA